MIFYTLYYIFTDIVYYWLYNIECYIWDYLTDYLIDYIIVNKVYNMNYYLI